MPIKKNKAFEKYMLIDGHALIHRAYHAIAHLSTKNGEPTNAVYGFTVFLLNALRDIKPTHVAVTFDLAAPTFRHIQYKQYKATRTAPTDELIRQFPRCKEVAIRLGIPVFELAGFEADDMLGTLASKIKLQHGQNDNFEIIIVTGDLDSLQLVNEKVKIYTSRKGLSDVYVYDLAAVQQRYGIHPNQFVDFKAIKGDPSDNIPGVNGIGEKGALDLIKQFGSVENIYAHIGELKEKTRKLFEEQREQLKMSYELSKIVCDAPIDTRLEPYIFDERCYQSIVQLFQELEFRSLIAKLPKVTGQSAEAAAAGKEPLIKSASINKAGEYLLVDRIESLEKLSVSLSEQAEFVFDTETDGLSAIDFKLVGISFSFKEGQAFYVPAGLLLETKFDGLHKVFADPKIKKIAHNIKYDYLVLKKFGIVVNNLYFDTILASYLLAPGSRAHDLDTAVFNAFGYQMQPIEELIGKGKAQITMAAVPPDKTAFYAGEDADFTYRLKNLLAPRLKEEGLEKVFQEIEMPLVPVLSRMEENGILLDSKLFGKLEKKVGAELKVLEQKIYEFAGEEFNINSPAQMKVILFDKLKISAGGPGTFMKKTKSGYSTAASELEKMRGKHEIIDQILNYRELSKLQSTYITSLPEMVSKTDQKIHTSFNQTIAATGRLSSTNPNLQNIPVGSSGTASEIRKGFVAASGYKLLSVDYSQIELRVVAHLSEDKTLMKIFKQGQDVHMATAMQLYGINDPNKITKEMRRDAKTINFGVLYGVSSFGLSERVAMSRAEAGDFIKKYFQSFPNVDKFLKKVIIETRASGFVYNELGRKRFLPEINASAFMIRAAAERAAINMPIQSLAADILKIAMINIDQQINIQSAEIKMLLQVHDELVFEVREDLVSDFSARIIELMENAYKLKVPVVAEAKFGNNWGEMTPV